MLARSPIATVATVATVSMVLAAIGLSSAGCSVLVNPDLRRLGGDGGSVSDGTTSDQVIPPGDVPRGDDVTPGVDSPPVGDVPVGVDQIVPGDGPGDCPGGTTRCGPACVNLTSDTANCGRCGMACPRPPNTVGACVNSRCVFNCEVGFGNCDGNLDNGCETSTATSAQHCGRCGNACPSTSGGPAMCRAGMCAVSTLCPDSFGNCDGDPANGCEASLLTRDRCGSCTRMCESSYTMCVPSMSTGPTCCRDVTGACGSWNCRNTCRYLGGRSLCCER